MLAIGAGPCPIEYVLAVGVVFEVHHAGGFQSAMAFQGDEVGRPAGGCTGALAAVQRRQVGVAHERAGLGLLL